MKTTIKETVTFTDKEGYPTGEGIVMGTPCTIVSKSIDSTFHSGIAVTVVCDVHTAIDYSNDTEERTVVIDKSFIE